MFNPIFNDNVQARKHPASCASAESELLNYIKTKSVIQKDRNDHKNSNKRHNSHDENHDEIELYQGNINMST